MTLYTSYLTFEDFPIRGSLSVVDVRQRLPVFKINMVTFSWFDIRCGNMSK